MIRLVFIGLLLCYLTSPVLAYKTQTHRLISESSTRLSVNYHQFLSEFRIDGVNADHLILYGSVAEDKASLLLKRYLYHFYDPINQTGLLSLRDPAPVWGYNHTVPLNEFSWTEARKALYNGLANPTPESRTASFDKVFRSLGQIIHLVEDMAQPSHTRNDPHVSHSESEGLANLFNPSHLEEWALFHSDDVIAFTSNAAGPTSAVSFNDVFETLALFSNENFISDDTIFKNYVLPSYEQTNYEDSFIKFGIVGEPAQVVAEDGNIYYVPYIYKTQGIPGGYKLAQVGYFGDQLANNPAVRALAFQIDDEVAKDNAQILIPKAVSYSAGLLDYFFRGQLEVTPVTGGLKVKNASSETMDAYYDPARGGTVGNLTVYYDDSDLLRHWLADYPLPSPLNPGDETGVITFSRPADNIKPGQYIVVFQGKLGAEEGAVIGKVTPPQKIYYVSKQNGSYKIYSMETDGSNPSVVYDNSDPNLTISKLAPSPDGKNLAFTVNGPQIYLLDLTNGSLSQLTQGDWPDWSPDGTRIAFERNTGSTGVQIFVKNLQTGNEVQLTPTSQDTNEVSSRFPAFSPDGTKIAFSRGNPDGEGCSPLSFSIYLMDTSGNYLGPLTCDPQGPWIDEAPAWSPDGQEIAFTRRWDRESDYPLEKLHKVSVGTKTVTKMTNADWTTFSELTPAWSSDGKFIVIGSNQDGDFDVWLVGPNGGYLNNLTNGNPDIDGYPAYLK